MLGRTCYLGSYNTDFINISFRICRPRMIVNPEFGFTVISVSECYSVAVVPTTLHSYSVFIIQIDSRIRFCTESRQTSYSTVYFCDSAAWYSSRAHYISSPYFCQYAFIIRNPEFPLTVVAFPPPTARPKARSRCRRR